MPLVFNCFLDKRLQTPIFTKYTRAMQQLYIIGNGFDRHHGLNTQYSSFGRYIEEHNFELYEMLTGYIDYPDCDNDLWYRFEQNLSNLDTEEILSLASDFLPNYGSDDFRDRDRYDFQYEMEQYLEKLTTGLLKEFRSFIEAVEIPKDAFEKRIKLDKTAIFLNFNYTDTLQQLYQIRNEQITYIHNAVHNKDEQIILGHGIDPEQLKKQESLPSPGLNEQELSEWRDEQANQYDHSYQLGEDTIYGYFSASFKNTEEIIARNAAFFGSLANIEHVTVLGHSVSEVDIKYFAVVASAAPNSSWTVSYFSDQEKANILHALVGVGINSSKITFFKMAEWALNNVQAKLLS